MSDTNLNDSVAELNDLKEKIEEAAHNTDDVKSGASTPEEEENEPEFILLKKITETSIEILQLPTIVEGFKSISLLIGEDGAKRVAEMIAVAMTHSATSAIMFYDEYLSAELEKQFSRYGDTLNETIAVVNGMNPAIEVLKTRIAELEKKIALKDISSE